VHRKPVITATQMLESMIENPRPTRAEVSDVANAIYDGSDAVMLSGETAMGKYPVNAVTMMARIVQETEEQMRTMLSTTGAVIPKTGKLSVAETICESMAHAAEEVGLSAIAVFSETGTTIRLISKYRPQPPIYALSVSETVVQRCMLLWGVTPIQCPRFIQNTDALVEMAEELLQKSGVVVKGELLGIVAGTRTRTGSTNFLRLHMVGDVGEGKKRRR
jgi:pyruvate kinase